MISLRSLQEFALDVLEAILPTDGHDDDLMAVADAVGVTAPAYDDDEPVPYTVTDRIPFGDAPTDEQLVAHQAICAITEQMAIIRFHTTGGSDFARWEAQVWS